MLILISVESHIRLNEVVKSHTVRMDLQSIRILYKDLQSAKSTFSCQMI